MSLLPPKTLLQAAAANENGVGVNLCDPVQCQSGPFSAAADAEKLENISCLTPGLSHRYNRHGRTQEEVVERWECGWRERRRKYRKGRETENGKMLNTRTIRKPLELKSAEEEKEQRKRKGEVREMERGGDGGRKGQGDKC
ncbi:hypothetical protein Q5P01_010091 [Channa striata]|uniref:Uncharacterized protein n=1 Tax=Channa striata TaxID=64152 RepID=A0AA88SY21_CHASR|nr:hypothetical protein Q5P01_010091 [Channa striata]